MTALSTFIPSERLESIRKSSTDFPRHSPRINDDKKVNYFATANELANTLKYLTTNLDIEVPSDMKARNQAERQIPHKPFEQIPHKPFEYNPDLNRNILAELPKNTQLSEFNRINASNAINQRSYLEEEYDGDRNQHKNFNEDYSYVLKTPETKTERLYNILDVRIY